MSKKNIKITIIAIIIVVIVFIVYQFLSIINIYKGISPFLSQEIRVPSQFYTYTSELGGFSITYPDFLNPFDTPQGNHGDLETKLVISNSFLSPYVEVYAKEFPDGNLRTAIEWGKQKALIRGEIKEIFIAELSTTQYTGVIREYVRLYKNIWGRHTNHCLDWFVINDQKGYIFSFYVNERDWDKNKDIFYKMIESIKFR